MLHILLLLATLLLTLGMAMSVGLQSVGWSTTLAQSVISPQLLDRFSLNLVHTFIIPRAWILMTLVLTFSLAPPAGQGFHSSSETSTGLIGTKVCKAFMVLDNESY